MDNSVVTAGLGEIRGLNGNGTKYNKKNALFNRTKKKVAKEVWSYTLAGVAQWTECQSTIQRVAGSIPHQGMCLGCRPGSQWGGAQGETTQ